MVRGDERTRRSRAGAMPALSWPYDTREIFLNGADVLQQPVVFPATAIARIRRKIEEDQRYPIYLQTVRGIGWMLQTHDDKIDN